MGMDYSDGGEDATFPHTRDTLPGYSMSTFIDAKRNVETADKVARAVLTKSVSFFFWAPDKILSGKGAKFHGFDFQDSVTSETSLYRQLIHEILKGAYVFYRHLATN